MQLEVGKIVEGKVSGITKFGAFVDLGEGKTGMVHISEVAAAFVQEIKDYMKEGETVKAKILSIGEDGKIALSMKQALPQSQQRPPRRDYAPRDGQPRGGRPGGAPRSGGAPRTGGPRQGGFGGGRSGGFKPRSDKPLTFEDMMAKFKQSSDERMSDLKRSQDGKRGGGYSRGGRSR